MATRINSCESESNLHHCFRCFVPMRALQFVLESLANRACCLFRAAETRSRIAREGHAAGCSRNGNASILQRLTHHFQRGTMKFRQLIEKKHAVVCQTDFTGIWNSAAPE